MNLSFSHLDFYHEKRIFSDLSVINVLFWSVSTLPGFSIWKFYWASRPWASLFLGFVFPKSTESGLFKLHEYVRDAVEYF